MQEQPNTSRSQKSKTSLKKKWMIGLIAIGGMTIISISVLIRIHFMEKAVNQSSFYKGIAVESVNVAGLSKEQAKSKIHAQLDKELDNKHITVQYQDKKWDFAFDELGIDYNVDSALTKAYNIGRSGNIFERYNTVKRLEKNGQNFDVDFSYDKNDIKKHIIRIAEEVNVKSKDAVIKLSNGTFSIEPEQSGLVVDVDKTIQIIHDKLTKRQEGTVKLAVNEVSPKVTESALKTIQTKISQFSTAFKASDWGRVANLRNAAEKVNGTVLMPGEVFSLDEKLGPRTISNGYHNAKVIVNGELTDGIAGGICQVASTIYNATLLADLQVVERRPHSLKVSYVPSGRDATVAQGSIDYKFKNTTNKPIYIEARVSGRNVYVAFWGQEKPEGTVSFESVIVKRYPPLPPQVIKDPSLPAGMTKVEKKSAEGIKVKVYKTVYKGGKVVKRELVNTSYYKPVRGKIRVGTAQVASKPANSTKPAQTSQPNQSTQPTQPNSQVVNGTN